MTDQIHSDRQVPFRQRAEEAWLRLVRAYTFNTPVKKGSYRLFLAALELCRFPHTKLSVIAKDGRSILVDLTSGMENSVFFHGEYEPVLSRIASRLIDRGYVCIDVGANFGWYTTLFAQLVGVSGSVHAFEPVPRMFEQLEANHKLLGNNDHVEINQLALGDRVDTVSVNLFEGESTGHASMASKGRKDLLSFDCQMVTLDSYLSERKINRVDFVKVDIEGAEMQFLRGARALFRQEVPPILLMEMALEQSRHFGYLPNDLLAFLSSEAEYLFYAVDELKGNVKQITAFEADDIGANVFCIPRSAQKHRLEVIQSFLSK